MKLEQRGIPRWRLMAMMLTALVCGLAISSLAADTVVVVANGGAADSTMDSQDVRDTFLGKKTTWSDGSKITLATLNGGDAHDAFLREYVGRTASQFGIYWKKLVFAGKAMEPKSFENEEELLKFVASTKGAVGYVSAKTAENKALLEGCKVLGE